MIIAKQTNKNNQNSYEVDLNCREFSFKSDKHGSNIAPSPYDYIKMALASCTAITIRMYAQRKNFPLQDIQVQVKHSRNSDGTENFDREVLLTQPANIAEADKISDDILLKITDIVNRCPVAKTLHTATTTFNTITKLVDSI